MRTTVIALILGMIGALSPVGVPDGRAEEIYPLVFPVAGEHNYSDTWGAARSGGRAHQGTDIMAAKMVPVVAAADGTVGWMHDELGGGCCAMALEHDDGWSSWYIHLNNDTPGTDDGLGWGFAPGIEQGVHVSAGQVIGYVGDSGNAEWTGSHLHFELHRPDGTPINPYPHLIAAQQVDLPRIAGSDRYATSVEVSKIAFPDGAETVFIATGTGFADALTGAAVAGAMSAPLLLSRQESLPGSVANEILRLSPSRVVVLGGIGAITDDVVASIEALGVDEVIRLAGPNRHATAAAISEYGYPDGSEGVILVNGQLAPDALSGSPVAAVLGMPMLLVQSDALPAATLAELTRLAPSTIYILGGTSVVSSEVADHVETATGAAVMRISGSNRYATSAAIAGEFFDTSVTEIYLATGIGFADALAAGPLAALDGSPVVLISPTGGNGPVLEVIEGLQVTSATVVGGTAAVPISAAAAVCLELPDSCS